MSWAQVRRVQSELWKPWNGLVGTSEDGTIVQDPTNPENFVQINQTASMVMSPSQTNTCMFSQTMKLSLTSCVGKERVHSSLRLLGSMAMQTCFSEKVWVIRPTLDACM